MLDMFTKHKDVSHASMVIVTLLNSKSIKFKIYNHIRIPICTLVNRKKTYLKNTSCLFSGRHFQFRALFIPSSDKLLFINELNANIINTKKCSGYYTPEGEDILGDCRRCPGLFSTPSPRSTSIDNCTSRIVIPMCRALANLQMCVNSKILNT